MGGPAPGTSDSGQAVCAPARQVAEEGRAGGRSRRRRGHLSLIPANTVSAEVRAGVAS